MRAMQNGKPMLNQKDDDCYLAIVSEKQGRYYFLTNGESRLSFNDAVNEIRSAHTHAECGVTIADHLYETDQELRHS